MIYIVTGDSPRCGSSMMMRALEAGGIENAYNPECTLLGASIMDGDIRELSVPEVMIGGFPDPALYDGKVMKLFPPPWMPLTAIIEGDYRIIWLQRDMNLRWESYSRQQGRGERIAAVAFTMRDLAVQTAYPFMIARPDVSMITMAYDAIVDNPLESFQSMASEGWPIDPKKAAAIVNPRRRHYVMGG